jgi:hypothetical protein
MSQSAVLCVVVNLVAECSRDGNRLSVCCALLCCCSALSSGTVLNRRFHSHLRVLYRNFHFMYFHVLCDAFDSMYVVVVLSPSPP